MSETKLDNEDRIPLVGMRYYRQAIRDVYGFLNGLNREYIKHSGLNNWDGVMDILKEVMENPEPLMNNPYDCKYPVPEKYQKKFRSWAEKQQAKIVEENNTLMEQRVEICKKYAEAPTWCNSGCPFYNLYFPFRSNSTCEEVCRKNKKQVKDVLDKVTKGIK